MQEPFRVRFVPGVTPGKWLRRWQERLPQHPIELAPVSELEQRAVLLDGAADMCFVRLPIEREHVHLIPLYREQPVVVAARDHPLTAFEQVNLVELAGEDQIRGLEPQQAIEVAASGAGVVVVPLSLARLHHRKDTVHRPLMDAPHTEVGLAWLATNEDPLVERFIGIVRGRTTSSSRDEGGAQGRKRAARGRERQAREARPPAAEPRGGSAGRGRRGPGNGGRRSRRR